MVRSGGSPNKNMGNCVLCIWKGPEKSSNALRAFERAQAQVNSHVRPPPPGVLLGRHVSVAGAGQDSRRMRMRIAELASEPPVDPTTTILLLL